ncbi:MAG: ElyC/SanA/YdcF family protein [Limisphaerales bacterium]
MLLVLAWLCKAPVLRGLARAWVVDDPPVRTGVIIALPLVSGQPMLEAARLYREGLASKVVTVGGMPRPTDRLGLTTPYDEMNRRLFREAGVPERDFLILGQGVPNANAAAQAVAIWVKENRVRSLTVVTEQFQTRRVKWCLDRALRSSGVAVHVRAVPVPDYTLAEWWRNEQGLIHFENEVVLNLFYRLNY